jgi:Kef-type K+ transport system membrane component KefB
MPVDVVHHVLLTLAAVIAAGFALGRAFRYLGQPPVIGEVLAGILLGPSVLGAIAPNAMHALIPSADIDPHGRVPAALQAVSQLGIVFYMFLVGLELNAPALRKEIRTAALVSSSSIAVPFALGIASAFLLSEGYRGPKQNPATFAVFMGVAMAITAFPVLARILTDRNLHRTPLGMMALGCAAVGDVVAWCLLSLAVGMTNAEARSFWTLLGGAAAFLAVMAFAVRPLLFRLLPHWERPDRPLPSAAVPLVFLGVLLSAVATEAIGIHAVFGAFIFGAIVPHDSRVAHEFTAKLRDAVSVLLLPAFFALAGLRTDIGILNEASDWLVCAAIIAVATLGKFGGAYVAARWAGQTPGDSAALGALMNTRGLMELIVLNVGLELGILGPKLYAMMVLMALATTLMASPMLHFFMRSGADGTAARP